MCNIPVNLPTLASFLMLYSLRCGCVTCGVWTLIRSLFVLSFFVVTLVLMYMPESEHKDSLPPDDDFFYVFLPYLIMIITESFIFMAAVLLAMGLFCDNSFRVSEYLLIRFCTMVAETFALICLSFFHHHYIGWYLGFLIIVILEIYAFMIIYSYYVDMMNEEKEYFEHEESEMGDDIAPSYRHCHELCVNYVGMPLRQDPSVSGVSQHPRDIEATRDTMDTTNTRPTGVIRGRSDKRKLKDRQNRDKRLKRDLRRIIKRFK